jgi:N-dimethylarginine dimethylaminohydrolase
MTEYDDINKFLDVEGFQIIKCSLAQQVNFIFNFLNIGDKVIIAMNKQLREIVAMHRVDVKVIDLEFEAVKNLYGGVRCATQVFRNILSSPFRKRNGSSNHN